MEGKEDKKNEDNDKKCNELTLYFLVEPMAARW